MRVLRSLIIYRDTGQVGALVDIKGQSRWPLRFLGGRDRRRRGRLLSTVRAGLVLITHRSHPFRQDPGVPVDSRANPRHTPLGRFAAAPLMAATRDPGPARRRSVPPPQGIRLILEAEPDIEVIGEAANGPTGISMASAPHPDAVLMDVRMPGMDGIQATFSITAGPVGKVRILATFDLDQYVFAGSKPAPADSCSKTRHLLNCSRLSARSPAETRSSPPPQRDGSLTSSPRCYPTRTGTTTPSLASSPTGNKQCSPSSPPGPSNRDVGDLNEATAGPSPRPVITIPGRHQG